MATIVLLMVIAWLNYARHRDPLAPGAVHAAVWCVVMFAYEMSRPSLIAIPTLVYAILLLGALAFSVGAYLTTFRYEPPMAGAGVPIQMPSRFVADAMLVVTSIGFVLFVQRARQLAADGPTTTFLINLRLAIGGTDDYQSTGSYGQLARLVPLSVVMLGLQVVRATHERRRKRVALAVLLAFGYAVLSTGRSFVFTVAILLLGLAVLTGRTSLKRAGAMFVIGGIAIFTAMAVLLKKDGGGDAAGLIQQFATYLLGPIAAFGVFVQEQRGFDWGANVLRTPLAVLASLGLEVHVPELVKPYVFVPVPMNVYTFYRPYYEDFGLVGVVLGPLMLGMLHGTAYRRARDGRAYWLVMYSLLLYPLTMQFFQDQYFNLLSTWAQYAGELLLAFVPRGAIAGRPVSLRASTVG